MRKNTRIKESVVLNQKNIYLATEPRIDFSDAYLKVRTLEKRVYSDKVVGQLPYVKSNHPQYKEWLLRKKSCQRFVDYLDAKRFKNILEIGCGNAWFIHQCSKFVNHATGVDINLLELEQGARVFKTENIDLVYWDIFTGSPFTNLFDIIVLNATVQYFADLPMLLKRLDELLTSDGEIHIIDSPFYKEDEREDAKTRSFMYYKQYGAEEMCQYYHHHSKNELVEFEILYQPTKSKLVKLFKGADSPFTWFKKANQKNES